MLSMIKKLLSCLGEYKKYAIYTPLVMLGEAGLEILIPFLPRVDLDGHVAGKSHAEMPIKLQHLLGGDVGREINLRSVAHRELLSINS